jgi:hypothetical protein
MVLLIYTLPLLGCLPMPISIGIRKALKVVITLRKDNLPMSKLPSKRFLSLLLMNLRDENVLSSSILPRMMVMTISARCMNSLSLESRRPLHQSFAIA